MSLDELVQYYNAAISNGKTLDEFSQSIGMQKKSLQQKLRRAGYVFDNKLNKYILKKVDSTEKQNGQNYDIKNKSTETHKRTEEKNIQYVSQEDYKKILDQLDTINKRIKKLEELQVCIKTDHEGLHLKEFDSPVKQVSYRYHEEVLSALENLCKKYPHYTKHAIINSLLMKGIESANK